MNARLNDLKFHDPVSAQSRIDRIKRVQELQRIMLAAAGESVAGKPLWFVLSVRNRCEKRVAKCLVDEKIQAWVPMRNRAVGRNRGRAKAAKPSVIFTGFVFVRMVPSAHAFAGLQGVRHVQSILGHGELPTPVPAENMKELMQMIIDGKFDEEQVYGAANDYAKGDVVEVGGGAFQFVQAIVIGYRGTRHVRCMANLFGGKSAIDIPLDKIVLVRKSSAPIG